MLGWLPDTMMLWKDNAFVIRVSFKAYWAIRLFVHSVYFCLLLEHAQMRAQLQLLFVFANMRVDRLDKLG